MSVIDLFNGANGPTQTQQRGGEQPSEPTYTVGDVLQAEHPSSCEADRGCFTSTYQRIVDATGRHVPVCRHCAGRSLSFLGGGGVQTRPNLRAPTKRSYGVTPAPGSGWAGAAPGAP